jgi:hypothetical protein
MPNMNGFEFLSVVRRRNRIIGLFDGGEVLVLDEFTVPYELLLLVPQRVNLRAKSRARASDA